MNIALVIGGLAVLAKGADTFVVAAARLAARLRLSPVVVGAVVVGFGTGAPELLVSSLAAARGSLDLAVGNAAGSNMANLTLVLGVAGLIARPATLPRVVRREAPLSLATVLVFALLLQGGLWRWEGALLVAALAGSVAIVLRATRYGSADEGEVDPATEELVHSVEDLVATRGSRSAQQELSRSTRGDALTVAIGLSATVAGAQLLVLGAQRIAAAAGLSGGFVGLTLVAIGTSLPELVTAVQSARRGQTALLAGNVLGSNVFNSTAVAGTAALIGPGPLTDPALTVVAAASMVAISALAWFFLGSKGRLGRRESVVLLALYASTLVLLR